jgi:hypothetical protein
MCRQQRMAELKARSEKARFGDVREITAVDYVQEVNKAGDGIMVVLHLYKQVPVPVPGYWYTVISHNTLIDGKVMSKLIKWGYNLNCENF